MKFIDEFRDRELVKKLVGQLHNATTKEVSFMEVCGGHTWAIQKFGIPSLLPPQIKLLSGPGCPVCVTSREFIDRAVAYSRQPKTIITTYGDLIRVPGSSSSLDKEKSAGADIRIVYSVLDALKIAGENPEKNVIFLGIGFETTAPATAVGIKNAHTAELKNFFVLSAHKIMPPAMAALIDDGVKIDGYIAPGHVSTIMGSGMYMDIPKKFRVGCVISGFEPVDILQSVYMLTQQINNDDFKVEIQYSRVVKPEGNLIAQKMMSDVFELRDDWWRGFGNIPLSGLGIKSEYEHFNAEKMIEVNVEATVEEKGCICGLVLKGLKNPKDCKLFGTVCTSTNPVGACMVSHEGACNAYYRFNF
jgi:hydrogenase expression/formation protein HypD